MKKCSCCKIEKPFTEFYKEKLGKDGYRNDCKKCKKAKKSKESDKEYYQRNKLKYERRYQENKDSLLKYQREYARANKSKRRASHAKRRSRKLNATPDWLSIENIKTIKTIYEICILITEIYQEEYHVDHIVPLQGEKVCGLHVPWNLQIISAKENMSKSNKFED